jgi:hypothetical protein
MDLTPAEQRWFEDTLSAEVDVPVDWIGRIALEAAFAERPDLARNFLPGSAERLAFEMLVQHGQETAALARGIPDAVARGAALRKLVGKVDPDFDFDLEMAGNHTTVRVKPKDPGALSRNPILGALQMQAPPGSAQAQAIDDFHMYGAPLKLTHEHVELLDLQLPAGLNGLFSDPQHLASLSIAPTPGEPRRLQLVSTLDRRTVNRLAVTLIETSHGPHGGRRLVMFDDAEILRLECRIPPGQAPPFTGEIKFDVRLRPGLHPHDAIPAVEFLAGLPGCDGLRIEAAGDAPIPIGLPSPANAEALARVADVLVELRTLQRVQDATATSFGIPILSPHDRQMLDFADRLLADGQVDWHWPGAVVSTSPDEVRALLATAPLIPKINISGSSGGGEIGIAGHTIPLPGRIFMEVTDAIVLNSVPLKRAIAQDKPPTKLDVHIGTQDTTRVVFWLEQTQE